MAKVIQVYNDNHQGMLNEEPPKLAFHSPIEIKNLSAYEAFLADNDIGIAGIEIIIDEDGVVWTYDINTNTNYNSAAEEQAKESAPLKIAGYLNSLQ